MVEKTYPYESTVDPARNENVIAEGVTFENFLTYFSEQHTEWLMGKVITVVSNNTRHQMILGFLFSLFNLFLGFKNMGRVLLAGVPMKIADDRPSREPDLMIVLHENFGRIQPNYLDGPADLVVEIVSPESEVRDWGIKLKEYEAAGVREYWLLDPLRTDTRVYALADDGRYRPIPLDKEGQLVSRVLPGFALHPSLLWQEELPAGEELINLVREMVR